MHSHKSPNTLYLSHCCTADICWYPKGCPVFRRRIIIRDQDDHVQQGGRTMMLDLGRD
jgi:hypothetical protein